MPKFYAKHCCTLVHLVVKGGVYCNHKDWEGVNKLDQGGLHSKLLTGYGQYLGGQSYENHLSDIPRFFRRVDQALPFRISKENIGSVALHCSNAFCFKICFIAKWVQFTYRPRPYMLCCRTFWLFYFKLEWGCNK